MFEKLVFVKQNENNILVGSAIFYINKILSLVFEKLEFTKHFAISYVNETLSLVFEKLAFVKQYENNILLGSAIF